MDANHSVPSFLCLGVGLLTPCVTQAVMALYPSRPCPSDHGRKSALSTRVVSPRRLPVHVMYLFMRKPFEAKVFNAKTTVGEVRNTAKKVGDAAESQVTLNIALTAVCVAALLVAALLVHSSVGQGAGSAR